MIGISWTTLNNVHKFPCYYWNVKIMDMKYPETENMRKGKKAHEKFAELKKLPLDLDFPKREVYFRKSYSKDFFLLGYADAVNYRSKSLLELKTVNKTLWTNSRMDKSMQPVYYSYLSGLPNVFLLTCYFDLSSPKLFYRKYSPDDWKKVEKWIDEGVKIIEKTDWKHYKCDGSCPFGVECYFYDKT